MTELRFHRDLYDGPAIDEAVKMYERHGAFELVQDPAYWVVRVSAKTTPRERLLSREFSNFALGLTVKGKKQS
jgi:hypothetical protein